MKSDINIESKKVDSGWRVRVTVNDGEGITRHNVTVSRKYAESIMSTIDDPQELVRASFEFLLDRESKESILSSFDLRDIETYFPEYPNKISEYMQ